MKKLNFPTQDQQNMVRILLFCFLTSYSLSISWATSSEDETLKCMVGGGSGSWEKLSNEGSAMDREHHSSLGIRKIYMIENGFC